MTTAYILVRAHIGARPAHIVCSFACHYETISLGVDCSVASVLRSKGMRAEAYPFDWNVTGLGVSPILASDFSDFLAVDKNPYKILFIHDNLTMQDTQDKYARRIERLKTVFSRPETFVHLIRCGHKPWHHGEYPGQVSVEQDIADMIAVAQWLQKTHPALGVYISLVICCACQPMPLMTIDAGLIDVDMDGTAVGPTDPHSLNSKAELVVATLLL